MKTAILAGGIAVVRSGVVYVGDGDEVLDLVLWRLGYRPDSAWSKKKKHLSFCELAGTPRGMSANRERSQYSFDACRKALKGLGIHNS